MEPQLRRKILRRVGGCTSAVLLGSLLAGCATWQKSQVLQKAHTAQEVRTHRTDSVSDGYTLAVVRHYLPADSVSLLLDEAIYVQARHEVVREVDSVYITLRDTIYLREERSTEVNTTSATNHKPWWWWPFIYPLLFTLWHHTRYLRKWITRWVPF